MMQMRDLSGIAQFLDGIFGVALRSAFFRFRRHTDTTLSLL